MDHVNNEMLEPNPKTVYGGLIPKVEGLSKCLDGRCSPNECHLTNIDLVLDPRQAPEHYKSSMFYKTLNWSIVFGALSYRSCVGNTCCIYLLVHSIYLESYLGAETDKMHSHA
jgi:hypothetical protein